MFTPFLTDKVEAQFLSLGSDSRCGASDRIEISRNRNRLQDSDYVYIGTYIDKHLQTFRITGGKLIPAETMELPGQPASVRAIAR
jgi:hypothetical protein